MYMYACCICQLRPPGAFLTSHEAAVSMAWWSGGWHTFKSPFIGACSCCCCYLIAIAPACLSGFPSQASELTSAVADMLSAAGMPLDLDKQQLLERALAADAQLAQVRLVSQAVVQSRCRLIVCWNVLRPWLDIPVPAPCIVVGGGITPS